MIQKKVHQIIYFVQNYYCLMLMIHLIIFRDDKKFPLETVKTFRKKS